ncbi:bifunctional diaminohydroxyphosphoribosylaminopyrimidine deaminase/5-amino-6-(5-phosphoribosylamino)uracil reductase RibD [Streptomyces sp. NPDC017615]|uniref:bifunctional diaminohydroxyphosphoribosylaminopyrimidine deaminase/5-amino-6-(5-phosphoribosylamino)uracil reductase RibD n=1 Tax=Streptomyces sp. NPDC017615 TaxID=3365003 RepID=UPI00379603F2
MKARELEAMRRAIVVSAQGLGSASPNPPVGCVILDRGGRVVGEGFHLRKGEAHAEVNALAAAGDRAVGGTAVVTLEPCNHYGRTPPCREALIDAGVSRVVIAVMDPTSRGEGGAALLREAGVEVEQGVLADEALLVLGPWLASLAHERPFITWVHEVGQESAALSAEVDLLRQSHDLVVRAGGLVEEGRPGSHGAGVFRVPDRPLEGDTGQVLKVLGETGARSVLVVGAAAVPGLEQLADRLICYLPFTATSPAPLPPGFRLREVTRGVGYVRVVGQRVQARGNGVTRHVGWPSAI